MANEINWYPGHMFKTKKEIQKVLDNIDVAVEIIDSRIPRSSRNYDLINLLNNKKSINRIIVLNKVDLSDEIETDKWIEYLKKEYSNSIYSLESTDNADNTGNVSILKLNANSGKGINDVLENIRKYKKGLSTVKTMIFGIPNVGKTTIINKMAGKNTFKTENRPGVTKNLSWLRIDSDISVLDTPGMLWPKLNDTAISQNLAIVGTISENNFDIIEIACFLIQNILEEEKYTKLFLNRYNLTDQDIIESKNTINMYYTILLKVAKAKNMLISGGNPDENRAARTIVTDFRTGKIGKITLERV